MNAKIKTISNPRPRYLEAWVIRSTILGCGGRFTKRPTTVPAKGITIAANIMDFRCCCALLADHLMTPCEGSIGQFYRYSARISPDQDACPESEVIPSVGRPWAAPGFSEAAGVCPQPSAASPCGLGGSGVGLA